MSIDLFRKYCVNDIISSGDNQNLQLRKILTMLEHYPNTGDNLRKQYADYAQNIGLEALSKYVLKQYGYEDFFQDAQQEQVKRLKNRPQHNVSEHSYTSANTQYQIIEQKKFTAEKQYDENRQRIETRHKKEIEQLQEKHAAELLQLKNQYQANLRKIQKEIEAVHHQIKMETDPVYAAAYHAEQKRKQEERERLAMEQKYLHSFDIYYPVPEKDRPLLFPVLGKLSIGERLSDNEKIWLETEGKGYFNKGNKVYLTYHCIEAEHEQRLFDEDKNVWHAVNASSHFRKANMSREAEQLLSSIQQKVIPNKKLKSAFLTTFGGVKRDLGHFQAGIEMAEKAHVLLPKEFRPCTLLGALNFEIREYTTGSEWFEKAEELGAPKHNTDAEIKAIYHKADKEKKKELKNYLLSLDTKRYAWLNKSEKHNVKQAANKVT
jgi:hypothetical protein